MVQHNPVLQYSGNYQVDNRNKSRHFCFCLRQEDTAAIEYDRLVVIRFNKMVQAYTMKLKPLYLIVTGNVLHLFTFPTNSVQLYYFSNAFSHI